MRTYLIFFFTIYYISSYSQQSIPIDYVNDVYALTLNFEEVILEDKCDCCVAGEWRGRCVLLRGTIDSVFFLRDTTVYHTIEQLTQVKYFSMDLKDYELLSQKGVASLFVLAENTCSPLMLKVNTVAISPPSLISITSNWAFSIGLMNCVKATLWQKVKLRFSGNVGNMKLKPVGPDESIFFRKVQSLTLLPKN